MSSGDVDVNVKQDWTHFTDVSMKRWDSDLPSRLRWVFVLRRPLDKVHDKLIENDNSSHVCKDLPVFVFEQRHQRDKMLFILLKARKQVESLVAAFCSSYFGPLGSAMHRLFRCNCGNSGFYSLIENHDLDSFMHELLRVF